jgi:hypothetical protein
MCKPPREWSTIICKPSSSSRRRGATCKPTLPIGLIFVGNTIKQKCRHGRILAAPEMQKCAAIADLKAAAGPLPKNDHR